MRLSMICPNSFRMLTGMTTRLTVGFAIAIAVINWVLSNSRTKWLSNWLTTGTTASCVCRPGTLWRKIAIAPTESFVLCESNAQP